MSPTEVSPDRSQLKSRRRVLQVITRLGLGGAERMALTLIKQLGAEMEFAVFTVHGQDSDEVGAAMQAELAAARVPWFQGTRLTMKLGGMVPGALALARAVRAFRPDLIHYHTEIPEACGAVMVARDPVGARISAVRTIHNSIFWRYWPRIGRWCDRRLAGAYIACVSEAARTEFNRYRLDSGAPPPPATPTVIYNGVVLASRSPRAAPQTAGLRRVLFAGRFEEQKGTDLLARALPQVSLEPGIRGELVFVGDGAHKPLLHALAAHAPAGWSVEVRPSVASLSALLLEFDLVVMPSRFEGLGLVAVEAALCGVPLVVATAPGLDEAVPPDHPWRFRPGADNELAMQLGHALRETERWPAVTAAAQAFARARFAPEAMGNGYRRLYEQAVSHG